MPPPPKDGFHHDVTCLGLYVFGTRSNKCLSLHSNIINMYFRISLGGHNLGMFYAMLLPYERGHLCTLDTCLANLK